MRTLACSVAILSTAPGITQDSQWVTLDGPAGSGRAFVYDSWRDRAVRFGSDGSTWEWDGSQFLRRPAEGPGRRVDPAMAFDPVRGHTLLFGGGRTNGIGLGDTWTWDGVQWTQPFSVLTPPRRSGARMTFDSNRGRVVMFGGLDEGRPLTDTWEHDGSQWIPCNPATVPTAASGAGMTFDQARGVSLLALNVNQGTELWAWNGVNWSLRHSSSLVLDASTITYDAWRQRSVVYGGGLGEVWCWDGAAWQRQAMVLGTGAIHGGAFDSRRGHVLFAGGQTPPVIGAPSPALVAWDGAALTVLSQYPVPGARVGLAAAFDTGRGRLRLFGGTANTFLDDQWEWDGQSWTQVTPGARPTARHGTACCFDPLRGELLLFGGISLAGTGQETWRYDGTAWSNLPAGGPAARYQASMVWDSTRQHVVMFGGMGTGALADTWTWNGSTWTQLFPAQSPSPRWQHAMAYDVARDRIVLFGGSVPGPARITDTWQFDGQQWTRLAPPTTPSAMFGIGMTHDPRRARTVLAGLAPPLRLVEVWEFDGADWTRAATLSCGMFVSQVVMAFDTARQRVLLLDGYQVREAVSPEATAAPFGSGCGTPVPLLAARLRPRTGASAFGLEVFVRPSSPSAFVLGLGEGNQLLGAGCSLRVQQPLATVFAPADVRGLARQPLPLPANHALRGLVMTAQAGALDPAAASGFVLSRGLRVTVGD